MAKDKADPKDPRFRSYRVAFYALYLAAVGGFSILIIASVFRSVIAMSPAPPKDSQVVLTERQCVTRIDQLWGRLEKERQGFSDQKPSENVDEHFTRFRMDWVRELRELEGRCAAHARSRPALREAFSGLERLMDLYMTHAVQYAGEVGPAVDTFDAALETAKRESSRK